MTNGPNGGYIAAILVRALEAAGAPTPPAALPYRALSARAVERSGSIEVSVEREGRSVSFVQARLLQDGRLCAVAMAVLGRRAEGIELEHGAAPPEVALPRSFRSPSTSAGTVLRRAVRVPLCLQRRPDAALTGGWLRPADPTRWTRRCWWRSATPGSRGLRRHPEPGACPLSS